MEQSTFLNPAQALRAAQLHEGSHVADFGAGSGFFTRAAARVVGEQGVVWAVDAQQDLLSRVKNLGAAEGLHNIEVLHADVERPQHISLPPEHFDLVICANLLFGVEHKQALVHEIRRVLKRHGCALVIDWSGSYGGLGPHPDHVVSEKAARSLFEENGFVEVEVPGGIPAGAYHWGLLMRKKNA
jgi:arsenite methyltransferase